MDQQILHSSPVQTMMYPQPQLEVYPDECDITKVASLNTLSPNTVIFAIDELSSVFRVADDQDIIQSPDDTKNRNNNIHQARYLAQSSFNTDGELSTFSEDTEEGSDESSSDIDEHHRRFYPCRRQLSTMSIFRASNRTKRRYEFEECNDEDFDALPTKRSCSAPLLCHANPIGSDDGYDDDEEEEEDQSLSSSSYSSIASPLKRFCHGGNFIANIHTNASIVSEPTHSSPIDAEYDTSSSHASNTTLSLKHLQHPLSLESSPFAKLFPKSVADYQV